MPQPLTILALDLGTSTGWAWGRGASVLAGTWKLATPKEVTTWGKDRRVRRNDPRVRRLCENIAGIGPVDVVVFEDVEFQTFRKQTQLWAALRSAVWLCAEATHFEAVPVATLKKATTGNGAATKSAMAKALKQQRPDLHRLCDSEDAVDAACLLLWALNNLTRIPGKTTV